MRHYQGIACQYSDRFLHATLGHSVDLTWFTIRLARTCIRIEDGCSDVVRLRMHRHSTTMSRIESTIVAVCLECASWAESLRAKHPTKNHPDSDATEKMRDTATPTRNFFDALKVTIPGT